MCCGRQFVETGRFVQAIPEQPSGPTNSFRPAVKSFISHANAPI